MSKEEESQSLRVPTPQSLGRAFERRFADLIGAKVVPGSGNQWFAKQDVRSAVVLWSLKWTSKRHFLFSTKLMTEVEEAISAPGGIGGETIPGVATSLDGEVFITLRADDFIRLFQSEIKFIEPTKNEEKRLRSKIPELFRNKDD